MASPQLEDGFLRIANELVEVLAHTNLSGYQSRILWAIFRKTYGFGKKEDRIPISQLVDLTGLRKQHVCRTLRELKDRNMVTKGGYKIGFNKDYQQWRELPKGVTSHHSNQGGLQELPTGVTKSNQGGDTQKKKETIQKKVLRDSPNSAFDVLSYLNEKTGRHYRDTSHIEARLKDGATPEECKAVIDKKLSDEYFIKNPKFLNPETLFRKSHWDKYLNEPSEVKPPKALRPQPQSPSTLDKIKAEEEKREDTLAQ